MILSFGAKIIGGKVMADEPKQLATCIKSHEGRRVTISVGEEKKMHRPRSLEQNAYYHGVCVKILADELGYTPSEMHEALKFEFLRYQRHVKMEKVIGGRVKKIDKLLWCSRSTTDLSTKEFEDFLGRVRVFSSVDLGIFIPLPNETGYSFELG